MPVSDSSTSEGAWPPTPVRPSWDDLLEGIGSPADLEEERLQVEKWFLALIREAAAPEPPRDSQLAVEQAWDAGDFRIEYLSYSD